MVLVPAHHPVALTGPTPLWPPMPRLAPEGQLSWEPASASWDVLVRSVAPTGTQAGLSRCCEFEKGLDTEVQVSPQTTAHQQSWGWSCGPQHSCR